MNANHALNTHNILSTHVQNGYINYPLIVQEWHVNDKAINAEQIPSEMIWLKVFLWIVVLSP